MAPDGARLFGWFRCPHCGASTLRPAWRADVSMRPPAVRVRYQCASCLGESELQRKVLNPGTLRLVAGIPLFAFALCALALLVPTSWGGLEWVIPVVGGAVLVEELGVILIERFAYTFAPVASVDGAGKR